MTRPSRTRFSCKQFGDLHTVTVWREVTLRPELVRNVIAVRRELLVRTTATARGVLLDSDPSTYDALIRPIQDQMLRSIWRITRVAEDAEDALQESLTIIWKRQCADRTASASPGSDSADMRPLRVRRASGTIASRIARNGDDRSRRLVRRKIARLTNGCTARNCETTLPAPWCDFQAAKRRRSSCGTFWNCPTTRSAMPWAVPKPPPGCMSTERARN